MSTTNTFATLTADGSTAAFELPGDVNSVDVFVADSPTWGGGTLIAQQSFDGGTTWVAVASASYTSGDGYLGTYDVYGRDLRFTISGSTTPDIDITVKAQAIRSSVERLAVTANGNTAFEVPAEGDIAVYVSGTFDSASLTVSNSPDGTLYVDSGYTAVTAAGGAVLANSANLSIFRIVTASVASAADLEVLVFKKH